MHPACYGTCSQVCAGCAAPASPLVFITSVRRIYALTVNTQYRLPLRILCAVPLRCIRMRPHLMPLGRRSSRPQFVQSLCVSGLMASRSPCPSHLFGAMGARANPTSVTHSCSMPRCQAGGKTGPPCTRSARSGPRQVAIRTARGHTCFPVLVQAVATGGARAGHH